jgi:hypothetical protein
VTDLSRVLQQEAASTAGEMGLQRAEMSDQSGTIVHLYLVPNRRLIVARQAADVFSGQVSSTIDIDVVEATEPGGYISGSASAQIGPEDYRETRVLSPAELRARAQEVYRRAERQRETALNGEEPGA